VVRAASNRSRLPGSARSKYRHPAGTGSPEDEEWVASLPSDEDLEQMARHAAWLDHLEGLARVTDRDIVAAGGAVG
jgi:hypothetical protein